MCSYATSPRDRGKEREKGATVEAEAARDRALSRTPAMCRASGGQSKNAHLFDIAQTAHVRIRNMNVVHVARLHARR